MEVRAIYKFWLTGVLTGTDQDALFTGRTCRALGGVRLAIWMQATGTGRLPQSAGTQATR